MFALSRTAWALAVATAVTLHVAFAMTVQNLPVGEQTPPAGVLVEVSGSLAGILGGATTQNAEQSERIAAETPLETAHPVSALTVTALPPTDDVAEKSRPTSLAPNSPTKTAPIARTATLQPAVMAANAPTVPPERERELTSHPTVRATTPPANGVRPERQTRARQVAIEPRTAPKKSRPRPQPQSEPTRRAKPRETEPGGRKPSRTASRQGNATAGAGGARSGGGGTGAASKGALSSYAAQVRARVLSRRPSSRGEKGSVVVAFGLTTSGSLAYARVARSSGNATVDGAALGAVRRATPFPRAPTGANGGQLRFSIPFHFR